MTVQQRQRDPEQARRDDFNFMVMCASKGNMDMYHLLRDRSLDRPVPTAGDREYESWMQTLKEKTQ